MATIYIAMAYRKGDVNEAITVGSAWNHGEVEEQIERFRRRIEEEGGDIEDYSIVVHAVPEPAYHGHTNWETWAFMLHAHDIIEGTAEEVAREYLRSIEHDPEEHDPFKLKGMCSDAAWRLRGEIMEEMTEEGGLMAEIGLNFVRSVDWGEVATDMYEFAADIVEELQHGAG